MLPQYGSPEDISALVGYLKTKPTGASIAEAGAALGDAAVDSRKLSAISFWGFVVHEDGRLTLTERGRAVARQSDALPGALRDCICDIEPYWGALERALYQGFPQWDQHELGAFWHDRYSPQLGTDAEQSIARACSAFMRVVEGAGLGSFTLGRRGSPSRVDLNLDDLRRFVEGRSTDIPPAEAAVVTQDRDPEDDLGDEGADRSVMPLHHGTDDVRVFVTHGKNMDLVKQVTEALTVANVEYELAVNEETTAIPVPEKILTSMRRCTAGVVIVGVDDENNPSPAVNENVLIEIGAAFVLYDKQVILVWDKRLAVPSNLQGLYRCEFEGSELGWEEGMKLLRTIRAFGGGSAAAA